MILSADELEIIEYLKSWKGTFVSIMEVCRSAGGRKKFRETPDWANGLMARLVDAKLIAVNERGHYKYLGEEDTQIIVKRDELVIVAFQNGAVVGEDYFPAQKTTEIAAALESEYCFSPQNDETLKNQGQAS